MQAQSYTRTHTRIPKQDVLYQLSIQYSNEAVRVICYIVYIMCIVTCSPPKCVSCNTEITINISIQLFKNIAQMSIKCSIINLGKF